MVLNLSISTQAEANLRERASAAGVDIATYAQQQLELVAGMPPSLRLISGPIGEAFAKSGMTEDELSDLLEQEKHAARKERRASRQ